MTLFLADDNHNDCLLFKYALDQVSADAILAMMHTVDLLMDALNITKNMLFQLLFLDLSKPRKNTFDLLAAIKRNAVFNSLPAIIFSKADKDDISDSLYDDNAHNYIRKPFQFSEIKKVIQKALGFILQNSNQRPSMERFLLSAD